MVGRELFFFFFRTEKGKVCRANISLVEGEQDAEEHKREEQQAISPQTSTASGLHVRAPAAGHTV